MSDELQPIDTAPKNGIVIIVTTPGEFTAEMYWDATGTNEMFCPGQVGIWTAPDNSMTWGDGITGDCGPTHWKPKDPT